MRVATEELSRAQQPKRRSWASACLFVTGTRWKRSLIFAALILTFVWRGFIPGWRSLNTDFPNYYLITRLYRQGYSLARVYEWNWFERQKDHAGLEKRIVSSIPLTLLSTVPLYPLSKLPPLKAKRYWLTINLLLLCLTGVLLWRITNLHAITVAILFLLAIEPLDQHFIYGQFHLLVLFLLTLSLWLYLRSRSFASGLILAAAAAVKLYPLLFIFYFLRKREWKATLGLIAGTLALAGLSVWLFGIEANRTFVEHILPRVSRGESIDPYNLGWGSMTALLHRLLIFEPELNPSPLAHLPAVYAILQALVQALFFVPLVWLLSPSRANAAREKLEYGSYVLLLLMLSTAPASYQYCALILTAVVGFDYLMARSKTSQAGMFVVLYTLVCLPLNSLLSYFSGQRLAGASALARLLFAIAVFLFLLNVLSRSSGQTWTERFRSPSRSVFLSLFAALLAGGTVSNIRSLSGQFENYTSRLITMPGSLMAAEPASSNELTAFTLLSSRVFVAGVLGGDGLSRIILGSDTFHPAFNPNSGELWLETADKTSTIVSLTRNGSSGVTPVPVLRLENAEQPLISPDGKWLAFIREYKGQGGLWIKGLSKSSTISRQLAKSGYDVMDVAFDPRRQRIIFAAQPHGRAGLFAVDLRSGQIAPIAGQGEARYPAFSLDGLKLAYCKLEKGNWHLWLRSVDSGTERRLTGGDCNSISPVWLPGSRGITYATDCGRGVGLTALAKIEVDQQRPSPASERANYSELNRRTR